MTPPIFTTDKNNNPYVRVNFKNIGFRWAVRMPDRCVVWYAKGTKPIRSYRCLTLQGNLNTRMPYVLAAALDVLSEVPAQMNCKYGVLEVQKQE